MIDSLFSISKSTTLVVGGGGFIGSQLVKRLADEGDRNVIVVGRKPSPSNELPADVRYIQIDPLRLKTFQPLVENCDEIIDLAYGTVPKTSYDDPIRDIIENLPFSVSLLRTAAECNLKKFILLSSGGTVYGSAMNTKIPEDHQTNPQSPYGITKLAIEKYGLMYFSQFNLPLTILRPSNPYGPKQGGSSGQGFIATALSLIHQGADVPIFGENGTVRDYIYISDLVEGILSALNKGIAGECYNIGSGCGMNNKDILDIISDIVALDGYKVNTKILPQRSFDVKKNVLCSSKLNSLTGWHPTITIEDGLKRTWEWIKTTHR